MSRPPRLHPGDVRFEAVRAQGPGGQNVNKVATAAVLRFDVHASSLPLEVRQRLLALPDQPIGADGVIVIKAQEHRSLPMNRAAALARLQALVDRAARRPKTRVATKPTRASQRRRLDAKSARGQLKSQRGPVRDGG